MSPMNTLPAGRAEHAGTCDYHFVSYGNSCRSQMAEAFARARGTDVMLAFSGGVSISSGISSKTRAVMEEKAVPLAPDQEPKYLLGLKISSFDVIVNFSGCALPENQAFLLDVPLPSPVESEMVSYQNLRDRIESLTQFLVEHFRRAKEWRTYQRLGQ
jgi:arsenate reductase (thioredoxin)